MPEYLFPGVYVEEVDRFLRKVGVSNVDEAMRNSLSAALQRNKVYETSASWTDRRAFRQTWAGLIRTAAEAYTQPVADGDHCTTIERISQDLSVRFGRHLIGGKLTFGTSQKALNLYLKFLWRLGHIGPPPHCPVDRTVLDEVRLTGSWMGCDSRDQYMTWITAARRLAGNRTLADWEYALWNARDP
jgi:hypothetical protein